MDSTEMQFAVPQGLPLAWDTVTATLVSNVIIATPSITQWLVNTDCPMTLTTEILLELFTSDP